MTTNVNIDGTDFNVDSSIVTDVVAEQEFCIEENIHVTVNIYQEDATWLMTSWLNGTEELNTEDVTDRYSPEMPQDKVIEMMESFVYDNEDYIIDVAEWDGN